MLPYAIHLRKSRADLEAEARGEGESLARHRKTLQDLADRRGYVVAQIYSEGVVSGDKLSERPEMQRLLRDVSAGMYAGVLDMEIARLTRGDPMDQAYIQMVFKYSGTKIITPDRIYDPSDEYDEDYMQTDMMHARRELKYTKKRLQRGRNASASEGLWQGPAPFGYRKVKIQRGKGWTLYPDPDAAPLVRMIYEMYAVDGVGGAKIADRLNALGSLTPRGNPWTAGTIATLMQSPVYIGKVRWNDRVSVTRFVDGQLVVKREKNDAPIISDGKHPALVPVELWEAAQRVRIAHDRVRTHNGAPTRNPLAGLVFCAVCGKAMKRKDNCGAVGSKYDMLRCTTRGCPTKAAALSLVERTVLDTLSDWLVRYSGEQPAAPHTAQNTALTAARANLQRLHAQRERIYAAFEDGAYDAQTFARRRADKEAEISAAEQTIAALEADTAPSAEDCIRMHLPAIRNALELYASASDPMDKNKILKTVISRIEYDKVTRCYRNQDPAKALALHVSPRVPSE